MIAPGINVASDLGNGVVTSQPNSSLVNHGAILAATLTGVDFEHASTGQIVNAADGSITATTAGLQSLDLHAATNFGSIIAGDVGVQSFGNFAHDNVLDNRGYIYSATSDERWR